MHSRHSGNETFTGMLADPAFCRVLQGFRHFVDVLGIKEKVPEKIADSLLVKLSVVKHEEFIIIEEMRLAAEW